MVKVYQLFSQEEFNTRLWLSKKALTEVEVFFGKHDDPKPQKFWKKIVHFAKNGLWLAEKTSPPILKHEWDEVYRFGIFGSLFRLIGFYADTSRHDFIVIDAFEKRGQKLIKEEHKRINTVVDIKTEGRWEKG